MDKIEVFKCPLFIILNESIMEMSSWNLIACILIEFYIIMLSFIRIILVMSSMSLKVIYSLSMLNITLGLA
jgi:hypothetical protein